MMSNTVNLKMSFVFMKDIIGAIWMAHHFHNERKYLIFEGHSCQSIAIITTKARSRIYKDSILDLVLERATIIFFLLREEMSEDPSRKQYSVVDRRSARSQTQSAAKKACKSRED